MEDHIWISKTQAAKILSRIATMEAMAHCLLEETYKVKRDLERFNAPAPKRGQKGGLSQEARRQLISNHELKLKKTGNEKSRCYEQRLIFHQRKAGLSSTHSKIPIVIMQLCHQKAPG